MREILFRGQTRKYGEYVRMGDGEKLPGNWVYGGVLQGIGNISIIYGGGNAEDPSEGLSKHCVHTDTLGQFTGLTDKNGTKIFEGDIIQYSIEEDQAVFVGAVKFGEFNPDGGALLNTNIGFYVELVDLEGKRTYMRKDIGYWVKFRGIEVIGNIHDNPELLKNQ